MPKLLDRFDTVLFDMDGVITSEQNYWNVAALSVWEMLHSDKYFGTQPFDVDAALGDLAHIRKTVFDNDRTIMLVKDLGINSNWDLVYVVLGAALIRKGAPDFGGIYTYLKALGMEAFALYEHIGAEAARALGRDISYTKRLGGLWTQCTYCFQEWFLGNELFEKVWQTHTVQPGKRGLMFDEEPLVDKVRLLDMLRGMKDAGKRLGIGTGRPLVEVEGVLDRWDIRKYFAPDALITYSDVMDAEKRLRMAGQDVALTKPHPYMFLRGVFGGSMPDNALVAGSYDMRRCRRTLVVGDAGADLYAAKNAGCAFAAVLTGIHGKAARPFFEREGADYILDSVLDLSGAEG